MALDLPRGNRGHWLAAAITVVALILLWFGAASPLLGWYDERESDLAERSLLARRMAETASSLPDAQRQAAGRLAEAESADELLPGGSDAIAGAALQEQLQAMAAKSGVQLVSAEMLPAGDASRFRRIALRLAATGRMPEIVQLLQLIETAKPRLLAADLGLQSQITVDRPGAPDLRASFTVFGFRAAGAPEPARQAP